MRGVYTVMLSRSALVPTLFAAACASAVARPPSDVNGAAPHRQPVVAPIIAAAVPIASVERDEMSCERKTAALLPERADVREGSAVAVAYAALQTIAYIADADSRSIHTVALDSQELGRTALDGAPQRLIVLADGRIAATFPDKGRVAVLEPSLDPSKPMTVLCSRKLPAEPWGIATTADDTKLVVSSAWGATLTVIDEKTFAISRTVPLPRDPRSVTVDDGVAFVSHSVGAKLSAVDLRKNEPAALIDLSTRKVTPLIQEADKNVVRTASQGFALARIEHRVLVPMTSVDPGPLVREEAGPTYYGPPFDGVPKQAPIVAVVDSERRTMLASDLLATSHVIYRRECLLPRDAVVRSKSHSLYVACRGIDAVVELDALAVDPARAERRRFAVPAAPEGLAIDERGGRLVAFSQVGAAVTVIPFEGGGTAQQFSIALDYHPPPELAEVAAGRKLFFTTDNEHISSDGLACASCHIDARDDGVTWSTPVGPRQTPMLAGRVDGTAPYGWEGNRPSLFDYISHTVINLGGKGLSVPELDALVAFVQAAPTPRITTAAPDDSSVVAQRTKQGAKVFAAGGCEACHATGSTDNLPHALSKLLRGDVVGGADGTAVDTPTLRFVGGTAPYFHDGRYRTLEDLLADPKSKMGTSAKLSAADRGALAAYLRTL